MVRLARRPRASVRPSPVAQGAGGAEPTSSPSAPRAPCETHRPRAIGDASIEAGHRLLCATHHRSRAAASRRPTRSRPRRCRLDARPLPCLARGHRAEIPGLLGPAARRRESRALAVDADRSLGDRDRALPGPPPRSPSGTYTMRPSRGRASAAAAPIPPPTTIEETRIASPDLLLEDELLPHKRCSGGERPWRRERVGRVMGPSAAIPPPRTPARRMGPGGSARAGEGSTPVVGHPMRGPRDDPRSDEPEGSSPRCDAVPGGTICPIPPPPTAAGRSWNASTGL